MAPRQRKPGNRGLPQNTRCRDGYYSWRHPHTGAEYGLGRQRQFALKQAMEANAHLAGHTPSLLARISGAVCTWGAWCDEFEKILAARPSKPNTVRIRRSQMKRLRTVFDSDKPVAEITTMEVSDVIDALVTEGKARTAQAFRSFLVDCFDRMVAKGKRQNNPVTVTDTVTVKVKRARLPFSVFMALYEKTSILWLRNAMAIAIVSGQDRSSCAAVKFKDIREGGWWNERDKTGARIMLPLELRLECFGMSLGDAVKQCRSTGVVSHYLIHRCERGKGIEIGEPIHIDTITRAFTDELEKLGLDWGDKRPPTFHEIRSLSGRLYREQGNVNPQELFGHKDPRTTAVYTDGRGEWVKVGLRN